MHRMNEKAGVAHAVMQMRGLSSRKAGKARCRDGVLIESR
jgi:hypothetical protein